MEGECVHIKILSLKIKKEGREEGGWGEDTLLRPKVFDVTSEQHMATHLKKNKIGTSLAVQWLGLGAFTAGAPGLIPGRGTKIP